MKAGKLLAVALVAAVVLGAGSTANVHGNTYGNPKAPVLIEVFSDFQCPGCKAFHDNEFQRIMKDYVVPGKVYVIYRYFPLQMHPYGRPSAEYACAAARVTDIRRWRTHCLRSNRPSPSSGMWRPWRTAC